MEEESEEESQYSPSEKSSEQSSVEDIPPSTRQARHVVPTRQTGFGEEREPPPDTASTKQAWARINLHAYRQLLNEAIRETVNKEDGYDALPLQPSQIGCTFWSASEKESFFYALDRKGKDDVQKLSEAVQTKSAPEIRAYLSFLQGELIARNQNLEHPDLLDYSHLPAALEIRPECEAVLNQAAKVLAEREFHHELKDEKGRFDAWSIIDRQVVFLLADGKLDDNMLKTMPKRLQSAMQLLKVETLVDLSDQIFMNPNFAGKVRKKSAEDHITPSILTTAIVDFQALVITLTKRLVQSSIYFAMSRLKAIESASSGVQPCVRKQDVGVALDVLGMKGLDHDFWPNVPRRYRLEVYDEVPSKKYAGIKYSHSQVEQMLKSVHWEQTPAAEEDASNHKLEENHHESNSQELVTEDELAFFSDSSANVNHVSHTAYAQALDLRASRIEEARLLELLCEDTNPKIKEEETELPKMPKRKRKSKEDLVDWRDWVGYKSEWERYKTPLVEEDFLENRRKRRRTRSPSVQRSEGDVDPPAKGGDRIKEKHEQPSTTHKPDCPPGRETKNVRQGRWTSQVALPGKHGADSHGGRVPTSNTGEASSVPERRPSSTHKMSSDDGSGSAKSSTSEDGSGSAAEKVLAATRPHSSPSSDQKNDNFKTRATTERVESSASASTSEATEPSPSFEDTVGHQAEQDARERSRPVAAFRASRPGQTLQPSSSPLRQSHAHDDSSDSDGTEEGSPTSASTRRPPPPPVRTRSEAGSRGGSEASGSDGRGGGLSFGDRLAAMRSSSQDLPLRRFLGS